MDVIFVIIAIVIIVNIIVVVVIIVIIIIYIVLIFIIMACQLLRNRFVKFDCNYLLLLKFHHFD